MAVYSDGKELIESGTCDAVLVVTPHYLHPELVICALEHGLHAITEKPAGVYTKQVREMNEAAEKSDRVFAIMLNQRTNCVYRKMHEMIASGELGQIKRVNWIITDWYRTQIYYDAADWKATWDGEGGGVLLNQCPHQLDLIQWLCGMPVRVRAFCHEAKWHDIEVEDDVTAYLEYENGATGVFVTTTADTPGQTAWKSRWKWESWCVKTISFCCTAWVKMREFSAKPPRRDLPSPSVCWRRWRRTGKTSSMWEC